jgi:hypothetical protein
MRFFAITFFFLRDDRTGLVSAVDGRVVVRPPGAGSGLQEELQPQQD